MRTAQVVRMASLESPSIIIVCLTMKPNRLAQWNPDKADPCWAAILPASCTTSKLCGTYHTWLRQLGFFRRAYYLALLASSTQHSTYLRHGIPSPISSRVVSHMPSAPLHACVTVGQRGGPHSLTSTTTMCLSYGSAVSWGHLAFYCRSLTTR